MAFKKILILLVVLIVASGCVEQPSRNNETNATPLPDEHGGLTEVHYNYVVPVNRTSATDPLLVDYEYQYIYIENIGDSDLSFSLSYSSNIGKNFHTAGVIGPIFYDESFQYLEYPLVINNYYFRIAYDEKGNVVNLNYSYGDVLTKQDNKTEIVNPGEELKDWNVKLGLGSTKENYYINFTILEPIPTSDD